MPLHLRNPHSALAALETRPADVIQVTLPASFSDKNATPGDPWSKVARLARDHRIPVHSGKEGSRGGGRDRDRDQREMGRAQVSELVVEEREGVAVEELFRDAAERKGGKGLWLALDSLQDPQNVGAIFRAAAFFGVEGILMTEERSAPLSATAYDVATGGVEYVPFTLQTNLQRAFEVAKENGLWILGTSEHAQDSLASIQTDRPWLLVLGNEEKGMRRLTEESCDVLCRIPAAGAVTSLNVSVAAGIFISRLSLPG